ncbi:putative nucleic acid-binding protein, contains PIN domain [Nostoc sp. PCC 7524]|uniref:type II toxin-antitoxin system VapC family toxin n=1 Tax=Nostoc sp. (strain ATCC 29411 / PCC 7524) TaxID=28072 RepID=UPI00029ED3CE|nr:PIN domain-containing protein [Nostoc sp. PCC 7524]AFY48923.1 putative nucleic acid-binding protein, contains PIN domain [Nostoc sp. PCC 7524]
MIRTFLDSGVLIYAARGVGSIAEKALEIIEDPQRDFASSIFLKFEVLPKAIYNQQVSEIKFYEVFFDSVTYWANDIDQIIQRAYQQASQSGLGVMDALHIAAAISVGATEFITNEKPEKSIHRTKSIKVISIYPL